MAKIYAGQHVKQPLMFASIKYTANSGQSWTLSSATFSNFPANASFNAPSVVGSTASAPATKIPGIVLSSMPAGDYLIIATGRFQNNTGGSNGLFRFTDGTNTTAQQLVNGIGTTMISGRLNYSTAQGSTTIQVQGENGGANSVQITGNTDVDFEMTLWYFPPSL